VIVQVVQSRCKKGAGQVLRCRCRDAEVWRCRGAELQICRDAGAAGAE